MSAVVTSCCVDHWQGLEALMENVASVGFTSCALRHNAKLPLLDVPGRPVAASPGQQPQNDRPLSRGKAPM